ncbi:uncharacterized protein HD556DRAFT_1440134 [Suillus plorans]|uniref:DUF6533 domain-containing protein n=1 Tax=Suillus plorans TaxID=116603 RepID=A0A9P7J0M2_9AGAM|nr:uncharacterized protein HD556DRAFT_1440134 [Suillus plorans]KAG1798427.1 hypothetical protein HD556DRAFT_1440134 [Suillus plorans]
MAIVSNDPSWWPTITLGILYSYWMVAAGLVVLYDWVLTFGQEIELIWRKRWTLMTVLYIVIRYIGILYSVIIVLGDIMIYAIHGANLVVATMLGVIMIARLHAMYRRSRRMLIFLVIIFLIVSIICGAITAIVIKVTVPEELILSGVYICYFGSEGIVQLWVSIVWACYISWECLALCLSVWVAIKHFRDLRRFGSSTGSTIGDYSRVLIQSHVLYFTSFVCVSCLQLVIVPKLVNSKSMGIQILFSANQILFGVQLFILGPRLILSVREHHAELVADFDEETSMNSIVFQERVHVSTSSTV